MFSIENKNINISAENLQTFYNTGLVRMNLDMKQQVLRIAAIALIALGSLVFVAAEKGDPLCALLVGLSMGAGVVLYVISLIFSDFLKETQGKRKEFLEDFGKVYATYDNNGEVNVHAIDKDFDSPLFDKYLGVIDSNDLLLLVKEDREKLTPFAFSCKYGPRMKDRLSKTNPSNGN